MGSCIWHHGIWNTLNTGCVLEQRNMEPTPSNSSNSPILTRCSPVIPLQLMLCNSAPSNSSSSPILTRCSLMIPLQLMLCNSAPSNSSSSLIFTRCSLMIPPQLMLCNSAPSNSSSSPILTRCSWWYLFRWCFVTQHQAIPVAFPSSTDVPDDTSSVDAL